MRKTKENWRKIGGKLLENWRKTGGKLEEIWRKSVCKGGWHYCLQENFCQKEQNLWMSSYSQNEEAKESARIQLPGTNGRHGIQKVEEFK